MLVQINVPIFIGFDQIWKIRQSISSQLKVYIRQHATLHFRKTMVEKGGVLHENLVYSLTNNLVKTLVGVIAQMMHLKNNVERLIWKQKKMTHHIPLVSFREKIASKSLRRISRLSNQTKSRTTASLKKCLIIQTHFVLDSFTSIRLRKKNSYSILKATTMIMRNTIT